MRIMGLDVGDKTIGVAISDEMGLTAQGLKVIRRVGIKRDVVEVLRLVKDYSVEEVVVGLPKNMDGTIGPQAQKVLRFVERLGEEISAPITLWDERLSTVAVTRVLLEGGVKRKQRKGVVDKMAAVYILQGYLDSFH
ncbi:MAG: Holliday junction resolvase RuvX [Deltaproteobacteria bacterium]|nr:Holliday junction resolvase RuvX [Deltaproteobacteria bacterium]